MQLKSAELVIDVHGVNKHFGNKHVVKDLEMQIKKGEIFGFLGPNGSGKTTSIRMMCGLLTPDSGFGTCLDYDILTQSALIKPNVGYMTQKFSFWTDLSIRENMEFVARAYKMKNSAKKIDQALEALNLKSRQKQLTGELSGGWKQRLALACCMLHEPKLLLLDEPTAGVDPTARRDFWTEIHQLAATGISILVSTHYMDEAERCHKLAYIAYGELLAQGTANEIIASQNLSTLTIESSNSNFSLSTIFNLLNTHEATTQVITFGQAMHISTKNLASSLAFAEVLKESYPITYNEIPTGLEDVFVYLMGQSQDNMN